MQRKSSVASNYNTAMQNTAIYLLAGSLFFTCISSSLYALGYVLAVVFSLLMLKEKSQVHEMIQNPVALWLLGFYGMFLLGIGYSIGSWKQIAYDLYQHIWIVTTIPLLPLFKKAESRFILLCAFLAGMSFVMCLSYLSYFGYLHAGSGFAQLLHLRLYENSSVYVTHITQNFSMAFASSIWLYLCYFKRSKFRLLYPLFFALSSINVLFVSTGRTGYLVFALLVLTLSYYRFGFKKLGLFFLAITLLFVTALLLPTNFSSRVSAIHTEYQDYKKGSTHTDIGYRVAMCVTDWKLFKKRPIFGYGTGGFGSAYQTLDASDIERTGMQLHASEITYLNIAVEYGSFGLIFLLSFFYALWHYSKKIDAEGKIIFRAFFVAFLAGGFFTAFLSHSFARQMLSIMIAMSFSNLEKNKKWSNI